MRAQHILLVDFLRFSQSVIKLEDVIVAKDCRISELEAEISIMKKAIGGFDNHDPRNDVVSSEKCSSAHQDCKAQNKLSKVLGSPNQVSDESCEIESDGSFSNNEELNTQFNFNEDGFEENADGRWNIPFDDLSDDGLVIKNENTLDSHVLKDIDFVAIQDHDQFPRACRSTFRRSNVSPVRPLAIYPVGFSASPILQAVRRGLVKDASLDKENVHPVERNETKSAFSSGFTSPCR